MHIIFHQSDKMTDTYLVSTLSDYYIKKQNLTSLRYDLVSICFGQQSWVDHGKINKTAFPNLWGFISFENNMFIQAVFVKSNDCTIWTDNFLEVGFFHSFLGKATPERINTTWAVTHRKPCPSLISQYEVKFLACRSMLWRCKLCLH